MGDSTKKHIAVFGIKFFPSRGGTSRVVEALLRYLKEDYTITIFCYRHPEAAANIPGVNTVMFSPPKVKNIGVFIYFLKCLLHLLFKGDYDLVHAHKTETSLFLPLIRLKYPVIITSHEIPYLNNKWSWIGRLYFHIAEWFFIYSGATRTSISKTQSEYYETRYHKPVFYIPNGIEVPQTIDEGELNTFLQEHQISPEFILFAARRVIPLKGCHYLIDALNRLRFGQQVVIVGDLEQMKEYTTTLINQSKGLDVRFIGYIESSRLLNALVRQSTLFVFPSEIEGMSMMLLEVASLGTPIICSDIPQNQIILQDEHALFFKSKDVADLQEKIEWALDHKEEMHTRATAARDYTLMNFGIEKVAEKYSELYNQHLKHHKKHEYT
jgi:glycosyltransferase involved in cell wall biosynthesis